MRIAHISDLHIIATPDAPGILRADTVARARALVADLSTFPDLDLVVITGDNVNDARAAEYAVLADVLAGLRVPYIILPGNHDDRAQLRALVPDRAYASADRLDHLWQQGLARVIVLDTLAEDEIGGRLSPAQLGWLAETLEQTFDDHTLIALHHPPCAPAMGRLDGNILIEGNAALRALLDRQPKPATLLCGHMHRPFTARFGKSTVHAATSTAFQFALALSAPDEPPTVAEPFHYTIHVLGADGSHVTHNRFPTL
ncbi:3',5'-cyclic AMP phosphodiesterase CpdA [Pseudorhodobacter antarcticus]|jgi:3',5'-cyclic AMP phosphodiesterase CpdA|uniref:3',5'-cyclic AMP phosphodiesterase CpdA n=1 Tax=Pseudorhodobacter antarcticus TaxID=1077947 RepID=A0A1H8L4U0_9RHOB|nr:metallophosphoesterase [Pseudorhodobacter antarcticus]SEO00135.1 3',5'-cyclic AMP phosphodiesterase CpdA [Pseudorhodobacter antarcticus]